MVLLHVKRTDELQFLFETPVASTVDDTVEELVEIWNMQVGDRNTDAERDTDEIEAD